MYFKKIEMHGFKSFAEPVTIKFSDGITGIVGPNGSGKSNISDAIRWVLGEQSPKMLRGGKMEEVIFSGTSNRKSRGMAEVTLVIDNSDGSLPIDYKEVALTRRMFRSGESEYHINGNQCRLRDIRELIMDTGIGVDGYSIIGQGKISDILSNKTESRREIFEEAAGIVMYRAKKAESERKLASTSANMDRVQDIIGEIEGRIDGLKRDSIKAKEYLKLRDMYKELEINITLKNIESIRDKNQYIKNDIEEISKSIDEVKDAKAVLEERITEQNSKSEALEGILNDARTALMEAVEKLNSAVNREEVSRERLSYIDENTARLREELVQLEEKLKKEELGKNELNISNRDIDDRLHSLREALEKKLADYNDMSAEMDELLAETDKYKNDIFRLSSQINSAKAEMNSLEMLRETLEKRKESLLEQKSSGDDSNKENLDRMNSIRNERMRIGDFLESVAEDLDELKRHLENANKEERETSKKFEELRITLSQMTSRKKTIEEMESNYEGYNYAVKHVMKSSLKGIHGVVAELIEVPKGYETAIETAMGASLQNIVCENDDSAKDAIRSLKTNRAGRMTFLPLNSIHGKKSYDEKLKESRGFIGFGPECLKFDKKYEGIISYLLGRVVVVNDMDNAVVMSKKNSAFRYVTLEGEVINTGGAMTGGRYRNRTANILDRKAEISELESRVKDKEREKVACQVRLEELRESIKGYTLDIRKIEDEIREAEHTLIEKNNELKFTESLLKDIKTSGQHLEHELENIARERKISLEMAEKLRKKIEDDEVLIKEAERLSEEKLIEYNGRKDSFDGINEDITGARIAVNSCEREREHHVSMKERIESIIYEIKEDMETRKKDLRELTEEKEKLLFRNEDNGNSIAELIVLRESLEKRIEQVGEEKAEISRETVKLVKEKEELTGKLEKMHNQKYELEIKSTRNETQLDTYKNRLWEEFEISYIQALEFKSDEFVMTSAIRENKRIKARMKELGEVNIGAIEEYDTVKARYDFLTGQRADIQEAVDNLNRIINDTDKTIRMRFKESFDRIVVNFEEKFRELFGGGHAELRLSDEDNPLESNIDIVAQPPGKKLQNINLLSGGEKTLTAIALMFAVLKVKPTPFCILDEVEAALDDANIGRFINCLRKLTGIQFALVTHQKATMEHADVLYGVTMPEKGVSKVLSLNMNDDFEI